LGFDRVLIACRQAPTKTSNRAGLVGACLQAMGFGFDPALIACRQAPTNYQTIRFFSDFLLGKKNGPE
jgi:hypothetical protein